MDCYNNNEPGVKSTTLGPAANFNPVAEIIPKRAANQL